MISEKYDKPINSGLLIAKLCIQINIVIGVLITIIYCGKIDFYPSGLTIGDTLFFVAASLAFALAYTIIVIGIFCAGITISPFLRWFQPVIINIMNLFFRLKKKKEIQYKLTFPYLRLDQIAFILIGILVLVLTISLYIKDFKMAYDLTLSIFAMSFIYGFWNTKPRVKEYDKGKLKKVKMGLILMTYLIPLIVIQDKSNILSQSMDLIGVRSESSTVQLSKKHTEFLTQNGIKHDIKTTENEGIYNNATILFRGIGNSIVVMIDGFTLTVQSKDIIIGSHSNMRESLKIN